MTTPDPDRRMIQPRRVRRREPVGGPPPADKPPKGRGRKTARSKKNKGARLEGGKVPGPGADVVLDIAANEDAAAEAERLYGDRRLWWKVVEDREPIGWRDRPPTAGQLAYERALAEEGLRPGVPARKLAPVQNRPAPTRRERRTKAATTPPDPVMDVAAEDLRPGDLIAGTPSGLAVSKVTVKGSLVEVLFGDRVAGGLALAMGQKILIRRDKL